MSTKVLFIGLGVMGYPMAGHLSKHCDLSVYNRTQAKAENWANEFAGQIQTELATIDNNLEIIITCIGNDNDLEQVYLAENGLLAQCSPDTLFIDHTSASASLARKIEIAAKEKGMLFIDAPVSGGEQGAINGQLTIMCGGDQNCIQKSH